MIILPEIIYENEETPLHSETPESGLIQEFFNGIFFHYEIGPIRFLVEIHK